MTEYHEHLRKIVLDIHLETQKVEKFEPEELI